MKIWLDSLDSEEIEFFSESGLLHGVTSNPTIVAQQGGDAEGLIQTALELQPGPVAVQMLSTDSHAMVSEASEWAEISEDLIIKIPATPEGYKAIHELSNQGYWCLATAIFTPAQALLAAHAGADYVAPYLGRIDDSGENSLQVVQQILEIFDMHGLDTELLAAGIREPKMITELALLGCPHVTVRPEILHTYSETDPRTAMAVDNFLGAIN